MWIPEQAVEALCKIDPQLRRFKTDGGRLLVKPKKALYGLGESAKLWHSHLTRSLKTVGYFPVAEDPCIFVRKGGTLSLICSHVDDLLILAKDPKETARVKRELERIYPGMKYEEGATMKYLGMEIKIDPDHHIKVSQQKYVESIITDSGISRTSPSPHDTQLRKPKATTPVDATEYLSMLMKLMYLA
jgi:hypothetical protein